MIPSGLPEEVKTAVYLLESFEKFLEAPTDHSERWNDFLDAIETLKEYIEENPESLHIPYVRNVTKTYIHRFLKELPRLMSLGKDGWSLAFLLICVFSEDILMLMKGNRQLKQNLRDFLSIRKERPKQIIEMMKALEKE